MRITIDLPEVEAKILTDKAARAGESLDSYVWQIAIREANTADTENPSPDRAGLAEAILRAHSPDDKAASLMQWLGSHDRRAPALPAEAVSREAVYRKAEDGGPAA